MSKNSLAVLNLIFPVVCVVIAGILLFNGGSALEGWGWFLFVGALAYSRPWQTPRWEKQERAYLAGHADGGHGIPQMDGWQDYKARVTKEEEDE